MGSRTKSSRACLAVVLAGLLALAGSGDAPAKDFGVCLVGPAPGLGDAALDAQAARALRGLEPTGVSVRLESPATPTAYGAGLAACRRGGAALTIGVGLSLAGAIDAAAVADPAGHFALLGASVETLPHRPANVVGLVFRNQEAGYLAGYAAGLWAKAHHADAVGAVGGIETPPLDRLLAGYAFGAAQADPGVDALHAFSDTLTDPSRCRDKAAAEIAGGAPVVFEAAGACGSGVVSAVREHGALDAQLDGEGTPASWLLASVDERAGVVVTRAVRAARAGGLHGGHDIGFGAKSGALAYRAWGPRVPLRLRLAAEARLRLLATGHVPPIPTHLK